MTSATEKLRRMLEERGVKYEVDNDIDANMTSWNGFTAMQFSPNAKLVMTLTPEQAIAATLGGANVDDALALLDEMNEQGRIEYADYSQLHDAIADELIAELGKSGNDKCYLVYEGKKYPAELDFGFLGMMPISITVGGFRYLVEVTNEE